MWICQKNNVTIVSLIEIYVRHFNRTDTYIYRSQILQNKFIFMVLNASLFIPNWQIYHELNLLAAFEFIYRQSSVLFISA